jgi:hypothetical protein
MAVGRHETSSHHHGLMLLLLPRLHHTHLTTWSRPAIHATTHLLLLSVLRVLRRVVGILHALVRLVLWLEV